MLMTNDTIRLYPHDHVIRSLFHWWVPRWVRPNHLTVVRFLFTPIVLGALWQERWLATLGLFLFAAFTDVLDGSLARLRKQITMWGTVADPVADKILIGSVSLVFVARVVGVWLALAILLKGGLGVAGGVLVVAGVLYRRSKGKISSANVFGKTKMFLQVLAITGLLLSQIFGAAFFVSLALGCFLVSFVFAFISFLTYSS